MQKTFERYGMDWSFDIGPIDIEFWMIRQGEEWLKKEGRSLFYHYREVQTLLWGDRAQHHEWSDLMLKTILENRITTVLGPKDAGKTHVMARYALVDYFAFPKETLILMSSTDVRGLELRVFGELKSLFELAKETWPDAPGNPVDSLHAIFTDAITEDSEVRDTRRGLICFAEGTEVDCCGGPKPIEQIQVGDRVINAIGSGIVTETFRRIAPRLVRIHLSNGKSIDCTPNHPILTPRGWVNAVDLETRERVFSAHETMRLLRQDFSPLSSYPSEILFDQVQRFWTVKKMSSLQKNIPVGSTQNHQGAHHEVLRDTLREPLGCKNRSALETCYSSLFALQKDNLQRAFQQAVLFSSLSEPTKNSQVPRMRKRFCLLTTTPEQAKNLFLQRLVQSEIQWETIGSEVSSSYQGRENDFECIRECCASYGIQNWKDIFSECATSVFLGHCFPETQAERGSGWEFSHDASSENIGRTPQEGIEETWVDRVEILQQRSDRRFDKSEGGYRVYNLEVSGHPSYSVNGVIVHNCIPVLDSTGQWKGLSKWVGIKQKRRRVLADETQFYAAPYLSSLANLDKGDFKGVFVGNPIGEGDPLDKLSEPSDGWDNLPEITATAVWNNRMGGATINFVGTDSPAIKHPGEYTYLINQSDIDRIVDYWGKESAEYYNQAVGVRRPGISVRRVVTRDMVTKFKAKEPVIWRGEPTTKVYAVDAGYGGDRCVGGEAEFGTDINGRSVLCMTQPRVIPIKVYPKSVPVEDRVLPEDQIAEYVKADCERLQIPAANVFHDSTGRGSLGTAFSRIWRHDCNPVEFGGAPTPRPVTSDLYIYDEKLKQKRLKRCDEHYSKRVSELHFSVRYIIEGGQMRGLTEEVSHELCGREWKRVKGDKIEVEAKDETKERLGRSPDLGDWAAIICEGARRLGFSIARLQAPESRDEDNTWKHDLRLRAQKLKRSYQLTYAS